MRSCSHEPMSKDQFVACFEVAMSVVRAQPDPIGVPAHKLYTGLQHRLQLSALALNVLTRVCASSHRAHWSEEQVALYGAARYLHRGMRLMGMLHMLASSQLEPSLLLVNGLIATP
jgi:hypothetical protein